MDCRDRTIGGEEQRCQRFSDDIRPAEDDYLGSCQIVVNGTKQKKTAPRRARDEAGEAAPQAADIDRVKTVYVFRRVDHANDAMRIDMARQRELNQHAINPVVSV